MNKLIVEKSVIERTVSKKLIKVYCIGNFIGKKIFVGYVDRSDAYLKRRLLQRGAQKSLSLYFSSIEPKNLPYVCTYCDTSRGINVELRGGI